MIAQTQIRSSLNGWMTMWIFWIGYALCQILVSGIGIMLPAMTAEMRLSPAQAGTLGAIG